MDALGGRCAAGDDGGSDSEACELGEAAARLVKGAEGPREGEFAEEGGAGREGFVVDGGGEGKAGGEVGGGVAQA